jgi:hypothetical protein
MAFFEAPSFHDARGSVRAWVDPAEKPISNMTMAVGTTPMNVPLVVFMAPPFGFNERRGELLFLW